jgi:hypothetical protein
MSVSRTILAAFMISSACLAQTPRDIAKVAFNSVVLLEMNDSNGQPLNLGSGFFISDGLIATNAHVIEGAGSGTAKLVGDTRMMPILGTVAIDRRADIALLKVASHAPPLKLRSEGSPVVGDKVYVVGNPLGLEGTFSEGIVSGLRQIGADSIIQMTAPISPGSSGGPVMDEKGSVIGAAVATFKDGQNLNLAVPVSYVSKLLSSLAAAPAVEPLRAKTRGDQSTSSIVDGLGTASEAGVVASNFAFDQSGIGYEFRLSNKLPVSVSAIRVRIIDYDAFKSVMDFEDLTYRGAIPSGLTKTVRIEWQQYESATGTRAWMYYFNHREDGSELNSDNWSITAMMAPKVEVRVVGFLAEDPQ